MGALTDAINRDTAQSDADIQRATKLIRQATQQLDASFTRLTEQSNEQMSSQHRLMAKVTSSSTEEAGIDFGGFLEAMDETIAKFGDMVAAYARETMRINGMVSDMMEHMSQLQRVVGQIDEIADETGHLAINAALEAARAGETGRSFMVVSSQIRSLAKKTKRLDIEVSDAVNSTHDVSTRIRNTLEWMATRELEPLIAARNRSDEMFERIRTLEAEIAAALSRTESFAEVVHEATSEALRALQFEDIVAQILSAAADRQAGLPRRLARMMAGVSSPVSASCLAESIRRTAQDCEPTHMPAHQDDLDEGDLVLF